MLKLQLKDGTVYVNPAHVISVLPADSMTHGCRVLLAAPIGFHLYRDLRPIEDVARYIGELLDR